MKEGGEKEEKGRDNKQCELWVCRCVKDGTRRCVCV